MPDPRGSALVIGVGPKVGVGGALCRRFGAGGYHVVPAGRTEKSVGEAAEEVIAAGGSATPPFGTLNAALPARFLVSNVANGVTKP